MMNDESPNSNGQAKDKAENTKVSGECGSDTQISPTVTPGDEGESNIQSRRKDNSSGSQKKVVQPAVEQLAAEMQQIRADLVRQEHRSFSVWLNFASAIRRKSGAPPLWPAIEAVIWWFLSPGRIAAIGVSFIGIVGAYLAYQANDLLQRQNFLLESDRRAAQVFELSAILDEIDEELDAIEDRVRTSEYKSETNLRAAFEKLLQEGHDFESVNADLGQIGYRIYESYPSTYYVLPILSARLEGRVIAIDKAFRPYRYLTPQGQLISEPVSPERGQLLISLIESGLWLDNIILKGDFSYADLESANITAGIPSPIYSAPRLNLSSITLTSANLKSARFYHVDFTSANFIQANLTNAELQMCDLTDATFLNATLDNATLYDCDLGTSVWSDASLVNTTFKDCLMPRFRHIEQFVGDPVSNVKMKGIEFEDVYVTSKDWLVELKKRLTPDSDFVVGSYSMTELTAQEVEELSEENVIWELGNEVYRVNGPDTIDSP